MVCGKKKKKSAVDIENKLFINSYNSMKHLLIIGARGFGREVYNYAIDSVGYGEEFGIKGKRL